MLFRRLTINAVQMIGEILYMTFSDVLASDKTSRMSPLRIDLMNVVGSRDLGATTIKSISGVQCVR